MGKNKYIKHFDEWNSLKKELNDRNDLDNVVVMAKPKDLWWCHVGVNIGSEQDGKNNEFERPIIVIAKLSTSTYLVVPTTSKFKEDQHRIKTRTHDDKFSFALTDQIKVIDSKRLKRKIGVIVDDDFILLKNNIITIINCESPLTGAFSEPEGTV